jgi:polysaccharide export outer membrane protein
MFLSVRRILSALACALPVAPAVAQRPNTEQAQQLLARPELVAQLRQQLLQSGLSAEQVRARLRAQGYPENLLDPYLPGTMSPGRDSVSSSVLAALRALGFAEISDTSRAVLVREASKASRPDSSRDSVRAEPRQPSAIYGLDVFRRETSQFDATLAGPVDDNYRIGPGDQLMLILSGQVEAAYSLEVTREGFVFVPQVGRIDVANLSLAQVEQLFYDRLGKVYSELRRGSDARTRFSVSPVRLRTNQVFVIGDVARPGSYRISGAGTVLTALYAAGGPTDVGTLRRVEVRRSGRATTTLDVYEYLLRGEASRDIRLENGDVVFVGVHGPRVEVRGEVVRPATYELRAGETLADLVRNAGGLTASASRQRIQIERLSPARSAGEVGRERFLVDVASAGLLEGTIPAAQIEPGDIVHVFQISDRVRRRVVISGNVWNPGQVAFVPGMTLSAALGAAGGIKPDAYLGQIVIDRLQSDSSRTRVYGAFRDSTGALVQDLRLQEDDSVRVFSTTEFRQERFVRISGAVSLPGSFPYREGMTLRDLVLQAGGLHERALLTHAEVASMPPDRSNGELAVATKVPLDSSYLFERAEGQKYLGPPGLPAPSARAPEVVLHPYDNVLVLQQPNWDLPRTVSILGEVRLPGRYTLVSKSERLSDLITRAGGLTASAYAAGVYFGRATDSVGRIGIDLPRVLRDTRFRDNLQLEDGDSIVVPAFRATVVVSGFVNSPVAVAYVPGKNVGWYINAAGGPTQSGSADHAWVVQPNGSVQTSKIRRLLPDGQPRPQPGSEVHVPERRPQVGPGSQLLPVMGAVSQLVATMVALIAIVRSAQ